jgi:hypothetical protein
VIHPASRWWCANGKNGSVSDQGALMFDDIDLFTCCLVARVVADSLGNFARTPRQRDAYPAKGRPGILARSEDFLMRPVDAGLIPTPR